MKTSPLATAIGTILATSTLPMSHAVFAQASGTTPEGAKTDVIDEVIATGSRIRKDAFSSSAPMDVIDVGSASVQGIANIGDLLQQNTLAAGSAQVTSAIATEFVVDGGLGTSTISLRGLGANRTLTLVNGRRAGPSGVRGAVSSFDLNVLPLATIERVEILKDGASSIYGSDAIAGVVNIITKKQSGGTLDAFVSAPSEGGGEESRISASYGQNYDRGNFRVTVDYNKREQLKRGDRDYFSCGHEFIFDPTTGERADPIDPRTGQFYCEDLTWGHVWIYDYAADTNIPNDDGGSLLAQPDYGDNLAQYIPGYAPPTSASQLTAPSNFFPVAYNRFTDGITNDDHPYQNKESLRPETELTTFYGEGELHLSETTTVYTELLFNRRETYADSYAQYWSYVYSGDFDFVGDGSGNDGLGTGVPSGGNSLAADAGWFGEQWFSPTAISDHNDEWNTVDYTRAVAGMRGVVFEDWDWDVSYMYSKSDATYTSDVPFNDSIRDQNWLSGSCVGTNTSVRDVPCIDIPWFDPDLLAGNISPELTNFIFGEETGTTEYTQWTVDGFITGDIYELPAGPLAMAVGFQFKDDEIIDTPGQETLIGNNWYGDFAGITQGSDKTTAYFAEFDIPVFEDLPGVRALTVNASARYTDVDSFGSDTTWKAGANWRITDTFRIRGNKATSFRSPALFELYLANQTGFIAHNSDPCIRYEAEFQGGNISENTYQNCQADPANLPVDYGGGTISPTVFTGGGLGVLKAETATSLNVGFVWQPSFAELSVSVDYFDFEVRDQVDQLGGPRIVLECYDSPFGFAFGGTEPLCNLFDRSGVNLGITNIRDSFINIAQQRNRGWDFATRYSRDMGRGTMLVDLRATRQVEDKQAIFNETPENFNGRISEPEWVGNLDLTYTVGNWAIDYGLNWVGETSSEDELGGNMITINGVPYRVVRSTDDVFYSSLSASYAFDNGVTLLVGGANIFDQAPPQLSRLGEGNEYAPVGNGLLASNYDMLGQRWFVNASWDFE